jgi:hypothetical protein
VLILADIESKEGGGIIIIAAVTKTIVARFSCGKAKCSGESLEEAGCTACEM